MIDQVFEVSPESEITTASTPSSERLDGVVIGILVELPDASSPVVAFPGNLSNTGLAAKSTTALKPTDIGRQVALLFENGDPQRPLVIGRIQHPEYDESTASSGVTATIDDERIEFTADKEIVLRCGKASITLTKAGKILIRGAYLLSRSSGVNRIKGGSVQIN